MSDNELQHHGIPGMKWGIRRYQNKDGSLTSAGRRRAAKLQKKYDKLRGEYNEITGKKLTKSPTKTTKPSTQVDDDLYTRKNTKRMSDTELKERTNRLNLENNYVNAINNYHNLNPKQVSKGKAFVDKVIKDVVVPTMTEVAKTQLKNVINNALSSNSNNNNNNSNKKKKKNNN